MEEWKGLFNRLLMAKGDQIIFGIHAVLEAVDAGKNLDRVLVRRGAGSDLIKKLIFRMLLLGLSGLRHHWALR